MLCCATTLGSATAAADDCIREVLQLSADGGRYTTEADGGE